MHTTSFQFISRIRHENLQIHFLSGPSVAPDYLTWPGMLRAAVLEALLEKGADNKSPRPLDETRFRDLLHRLKTVQPRKERLSTQTIGDNWQFAKCSVKRTTYQRLNSIAHTSVSF